MPDEKPGAADEVGAALELLWGLGRARTRGPKPAYSLDEIIDAAIALADREGLAAVSMQLLAEQLHFSKMALYRYVPGRAELVALMADRGLGLPPALGPGPWRQQLETWALAVFAAFMRHPWAIEATTGWRAIGPNEAAWMEAALSALTGFGMPPGERLDALGVLTGHVRAFAQQLAAAGPGGALEHNLFDPLQKALAADPLRFPVLAEVLAATQEQGGEDNGLAFGLTCILDGLENRVTARMQRPGAIGR